MIAAGLVAFLCAQTAPSGDVALVVGIEKYAFVEPVPGAKQNALDWRDYLRSRGARVYLLLDNEATEERVLAEAEKVAKDVAKNGHVWFVYVGHGAPVFAEAGSAEPIAGLVAFDAQNDALSLQKRSIPVTRVLEVLSKGEQRDTISIIDSCFSGKTAKGGLVPGLQPVIALQSKPKPRVVQMTAGRSDQFAGPLPGYGRPAFSYLLLGALKGWGDANKDGFVSSREATDYAEGVLSRVLTDRRQTPELVGEDVQLAPSLGETGPSVDDFLAKGSVPVSVSTGAPSAGGGGRTAGWVLIGVGGAVALGAAIFGVMASGAATSARAPTTPQTQVAGVFAQARTFALVADIGYVTGALSGVAGMVLLLMSPAAPVSVAPWVGGAGGGVAVSGAF